MSDINIESSFGIKTIDTNYLGGQIASMYLIHKGNEVTFIDTGTRHSIPHLKGILESMGFGFENIRYVIPTHLHLDHAAGAGALMKLCPKAELIIHPRGKRHMVDPSKLIEGTIAVYGQEKFNELYGEIIPVDADRVIVANDNDVIDFNGRILKFIDTPGHARHHFCVWDETSKSMFTGDTFGISYREFDTDENIYILPTTTPTQFDPKALLESIDNILYYEPEYVCLTHFGIISPNEKIVKQLKASIRHYAEVGQSLANDANMKEIIERNLMEYSLRQLVSMGTNRDEAFCKTKLKNDILLNTQGLIFWQKSQS